MKRSLISDVALVISSRCQQIELVFISTLATFNCCSTSKVDEKEEERTGLMATMIRNVRAWFHA